LVEILKKNRLKISLSAVTLILIILFSGYAPFLDNSFSDLNSQPKENLFISEKYLFLNEVTETEYSFRARGAYYIIIEIEGTAITYFFLDDQIYEVSYGINIFSMKAPDDLLLQGSLIEIDSSNLQYFKSLAVEPLFIAENEVEVNLNENTEVSFQAGGPISILTRFAFPYNWLYLELVNETGGSTLLKRIQDTAEYPEIDPLFYCLFIERGSYIRYDINIEPGEYTLLFQGNGSLEYKIMVNSDWDKDEISDVDELQQEDAYDFNLDPTNADTWGFFEKGDENLFSSQIQEDDGTNGFFSFFIPDNSYTVHSLSMKVKSGEYREIIVDGNATIFEGDIFISKRDSPPVLISYGTIEAGWHHISYIHKVNNASEIEFLINNVPIKVLTFSELRDTDGDGINDLAEYSNNLNPSKIDTDDDGIPDNYDASPLAKLELNPETIVQVVVPTDESRDTILNIQIKKPENDYSTNGVPRIWRGKHNVSIYPVLRMFGNSCPNSVNDDTIVDMTRERLINWWRPDTSVELFKSVEAIEQNFDETQAGDPLPNPDDPDGEFYFIFPKPSGECLDYSVMIPYGHPSKTNDGFLDLRFDFIWLVTSYDSWEKTTSILHLYDFEDNILIQSMGMREISNVEYILGNPDCFIDNEILWTLTQNPSLGTPQEFGVSEHIIGQGNDNYFDLPEKIIGIRTDNPPDVNETEVLYMTGSYRNYDILNKIHLKSKTNPDFAEIHQGDFEARFSSYSISNLYEDQMYFIDDSEIQGERKVLYQCYYQDFGNNDVQQRASILGFPIAMETDVGSSILKISQAQGSNVPLSKIPLIDAELSPEITILHQTYIERNTQNPGIPLVNFKNGVDIYKECIDNRQNEVILSDLFFYSTTQPSTPAELFQNFIDKYLEQLNSFNDTLNLLHNSITDFAQLVPDLVEAINILTNKINVFGSESYSKVENYPEFFKITQTLLFDLSNLEQAIMDIEIQWPDHFVQITSFGEEVASFSEHWHELIVEEVNDNAGNANAKQGVKSGKNKQGSFKSKLGIKKFMLASTGAVCVLIGAVMVYYAFVEISTLLSTKGEISDTEFALRMAKACATVVAGFVLSFEGILLILSAIDSLWAVSLASAIKWLGYIGAVLAIVIYIIDIVSFIKDVKSDEVGDLFGAVLNLVLGGIAVIAVLLVVFGGTAATGVGVILGLAVAAIYLFFAIFEKKVNNPSLTLEEGTGPYLSEETNANMRRHGGLEVGDTVNFRLAIENDGKNSLWIRSRFRLVGAVSYPSFDFIKDDDGNNFLIYLYDWEGEWDGWKGRWADYERIFRNSHYTEEFSATIEEPLLSVNYELDLEVDWNHWTVIDGWTREDLTHQLMPESLHMPALEDSIAGFYSYTTKFGFESLLQMVNSCLEDYRYKDAFQMVYDTIIGVQKQINDQNGKPGMFGYFPFPLEFYLILEDEHLLQGYSNHYYLLDPDARGGWGDVIGGAEASTILRFLIRNFWDSGFRALVPYTKYTPFHYRYYGIDDPSFDYHMFAKDHRMLIPKTWWEDLQPMLPLARKLIQLRNSLTFRTNIRTDLQETIFDTDAMSGIVNVDLKLSLVGPDWASLYYNRYPDYKKVVTFEITPPEDFSILNNQSTFVKPLGSTIHFTLIRDTPIINITGYYFGLKVYLGSDLLFEDSVPFKFEGFSLVEIENRTAAEPIVPGQIFDAIIVNNTGTYPECLNVSVTGTIPDNFVYKGYYPNKFTGNTLTFMFYPRESRIGLAINPPRHYTTKPGNYNYTIRVLDIVHGIHDILFSDTFEVAEFYDMDFELISIAPGDTIFDYQEAIYTFNVTNLGNVNQTFHISYDNITFANECLNKNKILLEPGEWQLVTLTLDPTGWGNQAFNINATSEHNSSMIELNITIIDDDINPPEISNFEIIDTPINVTVNFEVLNEFEGDDCGLSNIKIFIDNVCVLNITPDPSEITFSFTFNDTHGGWFMEYGMHDVRLEVIDNDDDVPNDALSSSCSGTFETTFEDMCEYVKWRISNFNLKLQTSSDEYWRNPFDSHKNAMNQKLTALRQMIDTLVFLDAYNKLLHDIKPKLTGLKTDENGYPWGNGVFNNPWVENYNFQESLRLESNELLSFIQILINFNIN
jgi:hypothetical protein